MKKIIIFGASGDIGRNFVNYILEKKLDFQMCTVSRKPQVQFEKRGVKNYEVDITDKEQFSILPNDIYAVVNFAGLMPARMEGYDPCKHINVNIIGNLNILEYCIRANADRILFAHSFGDIKDYGEKNIVLKKDMERAFSFNSDHTVYVMCKDFTVDLMKNYHEMFGLKDFVFRCPTIYSWSPIDYYYVDGIKQKIGYRDIIDKAIRSEQIEIWGDVNRKKDMVYVKDVCQMFYKALLVNKDGGLYNVGTGVGTSLIDQIRGIIDVFSPQDCKSEIVFRPEKRNAPQYIMDITEAKNELGYIPQYDYISMLKDMKNEKYKFESANYLI